MFDKPIFSASGPGTEPAGAPRSLPGLAGLLPLLVVRPRAFFARVCAEPSAGLPIQFALVAGIIHGLGLSLVRGDWRSVVAVPLFALVYVLVAGYAVRLAAGFLGGRGGLAEGLAVAGYSTMAAIVSWIPWIGPLLNVWGLFLIFAGITACFGVTRESFRLDGLYKALAILWTALSLVGIVYDLAGGDVILPTLNQWLAMRLMVWFVGFVCLVALALISEPSSRDSW